MAAETGDVLGELEWRGFVHQRTHEQELDAALAEGSLTLYCGFDPTADSLHVGSLVPIMGLAHFRRAGHSPVALVGGATGMIGDPSGKSDERNLLDAAQIALNLEGIGAQLRRVLDQALELHTDGVVEGEAAEIPIVNNGDWMSPWTFIDFLRDVGKHFRVNQMIKKDSVSARMENEAGISYTEFSYMLIQAYDFLHLNRTHGCSLQIGGSDQWGNITAGTDLIRRTEGSQAFGLTFPLLATSSGEKFGKTAAGAVWLDADRTSPYAFYQYWRNCDDADVVRFLKMFTFLTQDEIAALEEEVSSGSNRGQVQSRLAWEVTALVHGVAEADKAVRAARMLFGEAITDLSDRDLRSVFADVPSSEVERVRLSEGVSLVDLLAETGMQGSKGKAKRLVSQGGGYVNNVRVEDVDYVVTLEDLASESFIVLRAGRKIWHVLEVV